MKIKYHATTLQRKKNKNTMSSIILRDTLDYVKMDHTNLLFYFTDNAWNVYSVHRLKCVQDKPQYIKDEVIRQIFLEYEFRNIVDEIINTF